MNCSAMPLARWGLPLRILAVSLAVGISVWAGNPAPTHAAPAAANVPEDPFCYSWTFRNYTADDANGLEAIFVDPSDTSVASGIYTGTGHPFNTVVLTHTMTSSNTATTRLDYSDGVVAMADQARVGFCNQAANSQPTFAWSNNDSVVQPAPRTLGVIWQWSKSGQFSVQLTNPQALTMSVTSLWLYEAESALTPEEMTLDATSGMQPVANLSDELLTLSPNLSQTLEVQFDSASGFAPQPNHPFILAATFAPEEDLSDESGLMLQAYSPQTAYLPVTMKE